MPIPYRPVPRPAASTHAAYLHVVANGRLFYGGLLISDALGQPVEFVHTSAATPSGVLWPEDEAREIAHCRLAHSLFDACQKAPAVLIATESIGSAKFCREQLAPTIPFALVSESPTLDVTWIGQAPSGGSAASVLFEELKRRNLIAEPFDRVVAALAEVYPHTGLGKNDNS